LQWFNLCNSLLQLVSLARAKGAFKDLLNKGQQPLTRRLWNLSPHGQEEGRSPSQAPGATGSCRNRGARVSPPRGRTPPALARSTDGVSPELRDTKECAARRAREARRAWRRGRPVTALPRERGRQFPSAAPVGTDWGPSRQKEGDLELCSPPSCGSALRETDREYQCPAAGKLVRPTLPFVVGSARTGKGEPWAPQFNPEKPKVPARCNQTGRMGAGVPAARGACALQPP
jgi:hypothetical protein